MNYSNEAFETIIFMFYKFYKYLDIAFLQLNLYWLTILFIICLIAYIIYLISFDTHKVFKIIITNSLIVIINKIIFDQHSFKSKDLRYYSILLIFTISIWMFMFFLIAYGALQIFLDSIGYSIIRIMCFYIFWIFFNVFYENFIIQIISNNINNEEIESFIFVKFLKSIFLFDDIYLNIFFKPIQFFNNILIDNINSHYTFVWPVFFYAIYNTYLNISGVYLTEFYMLISTLIIFINLIYLLFLKLNFTKKISTFIINQLFYVAIGTFVILYFCIKDYNFFYKKDIFLNGYYLFSSSILYFKIWILFFFILTLVLANIYVNQSINNLIELPILLSTAIILLFFMLGITDIFAIILAFEILSLLIIGLCGLSMDKESIEASIKYFCQNSIITGITFFGVFFSLYIFKNTNLMMISFFWEILLSTNMLTYFTNVLVLSSIIFWFFSFLFKFGMFPVNFYVADIYNGSSAPVILFISSIIKPSILFLFFFKILPIFTNKIILISLVCCFCISSIVLGDWMSVNSNNIKRFFGHSSISQYGFIVLSLFSKSFDIFYYALAYLFIYNIALFIITFVLIEQQNLQLVITSNLHFSDLNNFLKYNLSLKMLITCCIILISGLPPLILFLFKYTIFIQIFGSKNYIFLILIFIFNTGLSSAYYFRIIGDIWAINLFNFKLNYNIEKKNLIFENTNAIDNLKVYILWIFLIIVMIFLFVYFDYIYNFIIWILFDENYFLKF